jgi:SAM-dependent methyltransferase
MSPVTVATPRPWTFRRILVGVLNRARRVLTWLELAVGFRIVRAKRSRAFEAFAGSRLWYQEQSVKFDIPAGSRVLDIGSGPRPFKFATELCDFYVDETVHRRGQLITKGLPVTVADVHNMPFADKTFDYVYTAHMLEHVDDPEKACREIMRIGKRGLIETPNFTKDILFCQAEEMHHRWHTVGFENHLFFFEYSAREAAGIGSKAWHAMMWGPFYHPLQDAFINNQHLFNTIFEWNDKFEVHVFRRPKSLY